MKLSQADRNVITNIEQNVEFQLSTDSTDQALLMDMLLSKMYAHPFESALREIICNAIDANLEAGNGHLPVTVSYDGENISVEDHGPGLSPERIINIYTKFGASSKRESNEVMGGFGIGAKSVLCMSDTANVTTTHDGTTYYYTLYLNDKRIPCLGLLHQTKAIGPNGTKVTAPITTGTRVVHHTAGPMNVVYRNHVSKLECIERQAKIFSYLSPVPIRCIINDEEVKFPAFEEFFYPLSEDIFIRRVDSGRCGVNNAKIAVGGVLYGFDPLGTKTPSGYNARIYNARIRNDMGDIDLRSDVYWDSDDPDIIIRFPVGTIDLSASRENVLPTDGNKEKITTKLKETAELLLQMQRELNKSNTIQEYIERNPTDRLHYLSNARLKFMPLVEGAKVRPELTRSYLSNNDIPLFLDPTDRGFGKVYKQTENGWREVIKPIPLRELLSTPVYVRREKDVIEVDPSHETYFCIEVNSFNNALCRQFEPILIYPPEYLKRKNRKPREKGDLDTIEDVYAAGMVRAIYPDRYEANGTVIGNARITKEMPPTCVYAFSDGWEIVNQQCVGSYVMHVAKALGLRAVYIYPSAIKRLIPEGHIHLEAFALKYLNELKDRFGKWTGYLFRLPPDKDSLAAAEKLARSVNNTEALQALQYLKSSEYEGLRGITLLYGNRDCLKKLDITDISHLFAPIVASHPEQIPTDSAFTYLSPKMYDLISAINNYTSDAVIEAIANLYKQESQ